MRKRVRSACYIAIDDDFKKTKSVVKSMESLIQTLEEVIKESKRTIDRRKEGERE